MNKKALFVGFLSLGLLVSCGGPTDSQPAEQSASTSKTASASKTASSSKPADEFTATFDLNYTLPTNSIATNPTVKTVNKKLTKLADPATRPGAYKFEGWFTDKTAGTAAAANVDLTANVTYYAHWSEYTWTAGTKTGALQEETSGTAKAYTLSWADKTSATSWDDTHMGGTGSTTECVWDCTGLPAGKYDIQISARGGNSSNLNVSWWGGEENSDPDTPKYYWQVGEGDSAVKANPIKSDYDTTGLTAEGSSGSYHLTCIMSEITIPASATRFSMVCTGKGYRLYGLEYVRLIAKA
ncbi:MAG: InlB B-repeat-containing protein [Bacilli bacterium]|nr:InlB B-repeat-containing protein [Bacilli bacterium]